ELLPQRVPLFARRRARRLPLGLQRLELRSRLLGLLGGGQRLHLGDQRLQPRHIGPALPSIELAQLLHLHRQRFARRLVTLAQRRFLVARQLARPVGGVGRSLQRAL